jgi:serine/threonine protein kinase
MFRPTQFGKYYLTERIAVGGMAELFKATLFGISGFEKLMVVKQILPKYSKNDEFIRMFVDEAKIAVTLTHGNIVPVYELGRTDGVYFIAMEYIHGRDLADILEAARSRGQPLSAEHAAYIGIEICKGLEYAHRRTDAEGRSLQVVHRDVSPPNILISFDGEVKIADFGIAKAAHKLGSTEAGVVKGTFGYMSPEQVRGLPLDHRTDIFSAGILLHEMLTGRRLFTGDSEIEAIERVKLARVPAPSALNPRVPAAIDPIVFKALAREPSDRFADANEFQLALSRFLFTAGKGATASTLSRYMRDLFVEELAKEQAKEQAREPFRPPVMDPVSSFREEPTSPAKELRPRRDDTQSFAVSPMLDRVGQGPDNGRSRPAVDVGAGVSPQASINATLAFPSLSTDPGAPPVFEEEATRLFKGGKPPQRPDVPALHFPPQQKRAAAAPVPFPSPSGEQSLGSDEFPSGDELAALADQLAEEPGRGRAKPPKPVGPIRPRSSVKVPVVDPPHRPTTKEHRIDVEPTPISSELEPVQAPPGPIAAASTVETAGPTQPKAKAASDSGIINLFASQTGGEPILAGPSSEMPPVAAPVPLAEAPKPKSQAPKGGTARRAAAHQSQKVSGMVSATMRLFVEGFDDEPAADLPEPAMGADGGGASGSRSSLDGTGDLEVPRTIKPTLLSWIIISVVVLGAAGFIVYKKTNLFRKKVDDSADVIKPEDLKKPELTRPAGPRGTIRLSTKTEGASFYFFVGETPASLSLDAGLSHLLRVERDGYQTVNRVVQPSELAAGTTELKISLQPVGAGNKDEPIDFKETRGASKAGKSALVRVTSEPPVAMVWQLAGREKMEMAGLDTTKSYNFKLVAPGHPPLPYNVAPSDFDKTTGIYESVVAMDEDGKEGKEGKAEPKEGEGKEGKAEPKEGEGKEGKAEPKEGEGKEGKAEPKEGEGKEGKAEPKDKPEPKAEPEPKVKLKKEPKVRPEPKIKVVEPKEPRPKPKAKTVKQPKVKVVKPPKKKKGGKPEPEPKTKVPDWAR